MNRFLGSGNSASAENRGFESPYYCSYNKIILKLYNDFCSNFDPSYIYIYIYIYIIQYYLFLSKFYKTNSDNIK